MSKIKIITCLLVMVLATRASGGIILEHTTGSYNLAPNAYIGQSFLTPNATDSWTDIKFSWLSTSGAEIASGNLFILSQQYSGSPNGLSSSTSGFVAESINVESNAYIFSSSVSLAPNTTYFAYMGGDASVSGGGSGLNPGGYSDGQYFEPSGGFSNPNNNYAPLSSSYNSDALFRIQGTATTVPEPSTAIVMGLLGIVGFAGNRRRRRQESVA